MMAGIRSGRTAYTALQYRYRGFFVVMAVSLSLVVVAGCGRQRPRSEYPVKKITIGVSTWPASAALYVGAEKGFFKNEGLDVELIAYASGHLALNGLIEGKVDFATASETPIAVAALEGQPLSVAATLSYIDKAITIIGRKDRGIAAAGDLKGKKIGVPFGTAGDFFLHIYLSTSYIEPSAAMVVDMPVDCLADSLVAGTVDAVCTWLPFSLDALERLGSNATVLHDPDLYIMTWNLAVARDLTVKDPDVVTRVLRAIVNANDFIREHPPQALAIVCRNTGTDTAALQKQWPDYRMTMELGRKLMLGLEDQARWMNKKRGGAGKSPNFLNYIYSEGVSAVLPDAMQIIMDPEDDRDGN